MRTRIPTVGGAYEHDSLPFDAQICVNLYAERGGKQSKSAGILRRCPGLSLFKSVGTSGAIRGMYQSSTLRWFIVRGADLVELDAAGTETARGTINTTFGTVSMTDNGFELSVVDGTDFFALDLAANTFALITDPNLVAPTNTPQVAFIDGYTFGFDPDSTALGAFRHSVLSDVNTWLAIDLYTAEGSPDKLVSIIANQRELWLFGSRSYEVWFNAGGDNSSAANPTWARLEGSFNDIGIVARHSVASMLGSVFWLGNSEQSPAVIYMSQGYQAVPISTKAITTEINKFSDLSDAIGFTEMTDGHYFYHLTFQTGNKTFVYDLTEQEWHTRAHLNTSTGIQDRHRAIGHVTFNNKSFVGDYENGNVYELTPTVFDDNGDPQLCERKFPTLENLKERISCPWIQFDVLTGVGLTSGQGSVPILKMRFSDDGGRTFRKWRQKKTGKIGEYATRVIFRLLGQFRQRIWHLAYSDPTPFSIQDSTVAEFNNGYN